MDDRTAYKILSLSRDLKADAAEVFLRVSTSTSVEIKDQKVDAFERARDIGVGLRVLVNGRTGFSYTTDLTEPSLRELAQAAVSGARNTEPDPFAIIPARPSSLYQTVDIFDPAIVALSEQEQIGRVMAMEREAYAVDPRVRRIRKATAGFYQAETLIANSHGASISYRGTAVSASIEVVAEEKGESQAGWESHVKRFYAKLDIEDIGRKAARKALDLLGACSIDSVKAPVVLEAGVAEEVLSIIASGFSAENVQKKSRSSLVSWVRKWCHRSSPFTMTACWMAAWGVLHRTMNWCLPERRRSSTKAGSRCSCIMPAPRIRTGQSQRATASGAASKACRA